MKIPVACIQTNSTNDITANIVAIAPLVQRAAGQGPCLITLPENVFYMSDTGSRAPLPSFAMVDHPGILAAQGWAREYNAWILVGSITVPASGEKHYNRSVLVSPDGEIAAHYDKIHLFDVVVGDGQTYQESARIAPGGQAVCADLDGVMLGMTVCYDVRFPHLYRALAQAGAKILLVPAAFTAKTGAAHWHTLLRARAIENGCYVVAPAQCGIHGGARQTFGHSLIIDPWGEVLADGGDAPGIITATLDTARVDAVRASIPSLRHDRAFSTGC